MTAIQVPFTDRQDWLQKRRQGIGASDIAAILGISPWATPLQVWVSKVTPDAPEVELTEDMAWGLKMENLILDEFEQRQEPVNSRGLMWQRPDHPWMLATPDGVILEDWIPVEAKKTDAWAWDDGPPSHYLTQIQWQMMVLGAPKGYLVALHRGRRLEVYPIVADVELQGEMQEMGKWFWDLVESETPPPATGDDNAFLNTLYPTHTEQAVEISSEIAQELRAAKDTMTLAEARLEAAQAAVKEALGDADTAVVGQDVICTWRTEGNNRFAVKRFRAEDPETAALFTTKGTKRVLRVKASQNV